MADKLKGNKMDAKEANYLKLLWNALRSTEAAMFEAANKIDDKRFPAIAAFPRTIVGLADLAQIYIQVELTKEGIDDAPEMVPPSSERASDGYWGFPIEGVHEEVWKAAELQKRREAEFNKG